MVDIFGGILISLVIYFVAAFPVAIGFIVFSHYLKKTSFSVRIKRIIFGGIAVFIFFPTFFPFVKFALLVPSFYGIFRILFGSPDALAELISWNIEALPFIFLCGVLVVFLIFKTTREIFFELDDEF